MDIYDKMVSILETLDIDLVDSLVKRGYLRLDLNDLSVTFHDTFLTQRLIDAIQEYLNFAFCALYLIKNRTYLFLEPEEEDSYANISRKLKLTSTYDFENSPKQAIDKYFYQHKKVILESKCRIKDTKPYWAFSYKSILIKHCTAEKGLDIQFDIVKKVNFSVYTSDIPAITMTDIRDEEDFYDMDVPLFCYIVKSNTVLNIDNAFNLHAELSLIVENSSITMHEDFTGASQEYCKSLTGTLLNRSIYATQSPLTGSLSTNRYQPNPKLRGSVPVSSLSEIRSWVSGPQPFTYPTATSLDEGDYLHNLIMDTNDFVSFVNIGVKAENYSNLKRLSDRSIGKFLIGCTYIVDDAAVCLYDFKGGCNIKVFVQSNPASIKHSKLTSIEESSGMSIEISTEQSEYDEQILLGSGFILGRMVQEIVECAYVKELIRDLDKLLGEHKYYLTLLCLNKNQLLDGEARDSFKRELIGSIVQDLQYTSVSYSLEPL